MSEKSTSAKQVASSRHQALNIALVAAAEHKKLVNALMRSAVGALMERQVGESQMRVMWSPQVFQLPLLAQSMAQSREFDGILVLGISIKDELADGYYFQNAEVTRALMDVMMSSTIPIGNCLVQAESLRNAQKITEVKGGDNVATKAATDLVDLLLH